MADAPDFARVRQAVEGLTATRLAFLRQFEAWLGEQRADDLPKSFLHAVWRGNHLGGASGANGADTKDAAALALLALGTKERIAEFLAGAVANGLFEEPGAGRSAMARIRDALGVKSGHAILQFADLQRVTHRLSSFPDPDALVPAILLARRRICRVNAFDKDGGKISGTGFLIGPQAVLTNWHVVKDMPFPLTQDRPLSVLFDFSQFSGKPDETRSQFRADAAWRLDMREEGQLVPDGAAVGWWMDDAARKQWADNNADALDFAVIRLQGAPGLQRGWYDLSALSTPPKPGECFVFHHPHGEGRAGNHGMVYFEHGTRFFHSATTARGSSGGLVIDADGNPVGLHYLGLGPDALGANEDALVPDQVINVAIPLTAIARALAPRVEEILATDRPVLSRGLLGDGSPVIGRKTLFEALGALAKGDKQVLWVKPPKSDAIRKPGKSYTARIVQSLFPEPENLHIHLDSDQIPAGARPLAALLLSKLSDRAAAELPESTTTEAAYDQVLVAKIREIIADRWPTNRIWLVIDDLDVHDLTDAGGRHFLNTLYARIGEIPQLRIVLIGLRINLTTIPPEKRLENEIEAMDAQRLADMFREWLMERGAREKPLGDSAEKILADMVRSLADREAPLPELSDFVCQRLEPALKAYLDA